MSELGDEDEPRDQFADLLELYENVRKRNVWSVRDLDNLKHILGDTHPVDVSIRNMFRAAASQSGYGPEASAKLKRLSESIIQSLPLKIGRFNKDYTPRYAALNRTTPPTQLRGMQPDYIEKRPGGSVTRFYKTLQDANVLERAKEQYGPDVSVLQYKIPPGARQRSQTSRQYIKTITTVIDYVTGDDVPLSILNIIADSDRVNSGHIIVRV